MKRKTLFSLLGSPWKRRNQSNKSMQTVMEMPESEGHDLEPLSDLEAINDSEPIINKLPLPETADAETTTEQDSVYHPAPLIDAPPIETGPRVDLVPAEVSHPNDESNANGSATVRVAPPMLEAPEPTLQHAPLDTDSKTPRNVIPNYPESTESDNPRSSQRHPETPTLKAVRDMIKA